jgi:hypothetical protein
MLDNCQRLMSLISESWSFTKNSSPVEKNVREK